MTEEQDGEDAAVRSTRLGATPETAPFRANHEPSNHPDAETVKMNVSDGGRSGAAVDRSAAKSEPMSDPAHGFK
jgi:hypothetical protein